MQARATKTHWRPKLETLIIEAYAFNDIMARNRAATGFNGRGWNFDRH